MTRAKKFIEKAKCKNNHCSFMSPSAWSDLIKDCIILKLHDVCPNPKCNCQKISTFTPNLYMLEDGSIKRKLEKKFKGTEKAWNKFLKPALNTASPYIGMAMSARTKNPQIGKATSDILKSISGGGGFLSLTDMHGRGLRLKVMSNHFK